MFTYQQSLTAEITTVERPAYHIPVNQPIYISGMNMGVKLQKSETEFGGYACTAVMATNTRHSCRMDLGAEPPIRTIMPVTFTRKPYGKALLKTQIRYNGSVVFQHAVTGIAPTEGSLGGGNVLSVSGFGLDSPNLVVKIGTEACVLVNQTYTKIMCTIPAVEGEGKLSVTVFDSSYTEKEQTETVTGI